MKIEIASFGREVLCGGLVLGLLTAVGCRNDSPRSGSNAPCVVDSSLGLEMVLVPAGWFEMGSAESGEPDETPHRVCLDAFYMDRYEVTQEAYEKLTGKTPARFPGAKNPVEQIRWRDAVEFCNARSVLEGLQPAYDPETWTCDFSADGYRLPTEAEWEYAARAGTTTAYCCGDGAAELKRYAWFKENSLRGPHAVGEGEPNPWGLYDLYGNVWEWCHDFYREEYYRESPQQNPRGPETGENRVVRGGSWNSRPDECRSAYRYYEIPAYTDVCFAKDVHGMVGFRCVRRCAAARQATAREPQPRD